MISPSTSATILELKDEVRALLASGTDPGTLADAFATVLMEHAKTTDEENPEEVSEDHDSSEAGRKTVRAAVTLIYHAIWPMDRIDGIRVLLSTVALRSLTGLPADKRGFLRGMLVELLESHLAQTARKLDELRAAEKMRENEPDRQALEGMLP